MRKYISTLLFVSSLELTKAQQTLNDIESNDQQNPAQMDEGENTSSIPVEVFEMDPNWYSDDNLPSMADLIIDPEYTENDNQASGHRRLNGQDELTPVPNVAILESNLYDADYNMQALKAHNIYRRAHQVCDLKFSAEAAATAQKWAEHLSKTGKMEHSKSSQRNGCGENIAMHSNTNLLSNSNVATDMWYDEVNKPGYDFENGGFSMGTGHFTQVVWKGTSELGCGISGKYVVCQYCNSPGNMMGAFQQNVFPKGREGAQCDRNDTQSSDSNNKEDNKEDNIDEDIEDDKEDNDIDDENEDNDDEDSNDDDIEDDNDEDMGDDNSDSVDSNGNDINNGGKDKPDERPNSEDEKPKKRRCGPNWQDNNKDDVDIKGGQYSLAKFRMSCEGPEQGRYLGVFQTAQQCQATARRAGCDVFMHSNLIPAWGCRCCRSTSGLTKHNYWNVYSANNDNGNDSQPDQKGDPQLEVEDEAEEVGNENDQSGEYSLTRSRMSCENREQGRFLGVFRTAQQCEATAKDAGCDIFMHSDAYPSWGCRCCNSISGLTRHGLWNVYSNEDGKAHIKQLRGSQRNGRNNRRNGNRNNRRNGNRNNRRNGNRKNRRNGNRNSRSSGFRRNGRNVRMSNGFIGSP